MEKLTKKPLILALLLLFGLMVSIGVWLLFTAVSPVSDKSDIVEFLIEQGDTLSVIAGNLQRKNIIRNETVFTAYSYWQGQSEQFKSGRYFIDRQNGLAMIHDQLLAGGEAEYVRVTIPEGFTTRQIAERIAGYGICKAVEFLAAVENPQNPSGYPLPASGASGFLFPDTYYLAPAMSGDQLVNLMVDNFFERLAAIYPEYRRLLPEQLFEKIVLASIVEREYQLAEEAPKIARVFYNRLEIGMALESCATVVYVITEELGKPHPSRLFIRDLDYESDFNTYLHRGLPPGAIANSGRTALNAVFYPADGDFLFFLVKDPTIGAHTFSKSLSEHNRAYNLYIKPLYQD